MNATHGRHAWYRMHWIVLLWLLALGGCSSTATVRTLLPSDQVFAVEGLRVLYLQREASINSTHPIFNDARLNESVAELGHAVMAVLPAGFENAGIESRSLHVKTDKSASLTSEAMDFLLHEQPDWPVLIVVPSGGRVFCSPCNIKNDVILELRIKGKAVWAVRMQEPTTSGSITGGTEGVQRHYAQEILRVAQTQIKAAAQR
ncbi:hypothetical protein [Leptothrix discophora]|uniref:Lipoprotein n=1 Tax=Leptothrix discophora TaxID=89 RepID=A0ABT9G429_LEPDI|nr:hypothetical protein [Leptothrix discophora]MDP4301212.1 hypothetical protein [Leptothrix discophora]